MKHIFFLLSIDKWIAKAIRNSKLFVITGYTLVDSGFLFSTSTHILMLTYTDNDAELRRAYTMTSWCPDMYTLATCFQYTIQDRRKVVSSVQWRTNCHNELPWTGSMLCIRIIKYAM